MTTNPSTKRVQSVAVEQVGRSQPARSASDPRSNNWKRRLEELAAFKKKHGHCRVSTLSKDHASLAHWVAAQRHARHVGKLSAEQVQRLDELAFSWNVRDELDRAAWEAMYQKLAAYQRAHGHCRVPTTKKCSRLRQWVVRQRVARRKRKLSADQARKLRQLNFVWDQQEEQWKRMLASLLKYKKSHGNCDVPGGWPRNPKLAAWVNRQRKCCRRGTL
ncbi:MAG: helicase associated domain-containing protein, partial [Thermoguttaceae bacterium]